MSNQLIPIDVSTYTLVVQACERGREYKKALEVYEMMREGGVAFYGNKILDGGFKRVLKLVNEATNIF